MGSEIIRITDYINVLYAGYFFVALILRMSDKKSITNKTACYLIGILLSLSGNAVCHLTAMSQYKPYIIVIALLSYLVTVTVTVAAVNGDGIGRKALIVLVSIVPVLLLSLLLDLYFKFVLGMPVNEFGNPYLISILRTYIMTLSIVCSMCVVLFIGRREVAGSTNSISIMVLFALLGFMDLSFLINVAPHKAGAANVIGGTVQNMIIASISLALLGILRKSNDIIAKERQQRGLQSLRELNKNYYDTVQSDITRARKLKHDIANYIEQIEYLLSHPETDSNDVLRSMAEELKIKADSIESRKYCDDSLVNMILTLKSEKCKDMGIPFLVKVNLPQVPEIEPLDRSSILSNLIDNAIKAAKEYKDSGKDTEVAVSIGVLGDYYAIRTENDTVFDGEIDDLKSLMNSIDKKDIKDGHGYGLAIVQEIVSKYGGDVVVNIKDHKCAIIVTVKSGKEGVLSNV